MNKTNITLDKNSFSIEYNNKLEYENSKLAFINDKEIFIQKNNFYSQEDDDRLSIKFLYKNNHKIIYEEFEKILHHLLFTLKIISKECFDDGIKNALNILDSKKFLFMVDDQRKFLVEFDKNELILHPIYNESFKSNGELYEYYKTFFKIMLNEIEGFVRTKIRLENKKLYIDYYDAIDQFFYLMKIAITSKELFDQNFDCAEFMQRIACFIVKNVANK